MMLVLSTRAAVRARRAELRLRGHRLALVPTMGALHDGHLSLVRRAREMCDEVWASVFVNPAQFGPGEDFERYPRDLERDRDLLAGEGVAVLFAPATKEIYPRPPAATVTVPSLSRGLCGAHRPGHFDGVALVVAKLLNIVQPDVAVFGAKDFQQAAVVRRLVEDLDLAVKIEVAPTAREGDGLAMSSRNAHLSSDDRHAATILIAALRAAAVAVEGGERSGGVLEQLLTERVASEPRARLQYAAAVDPETLEPVATVGKRVLLAVAARVGTTRLIDNLLVEVP
jgi:pantoate--beta-alanine ligase